MDKISIIKENSDSIEISRGQRGAMGYTIKVYGDEITKLKAKVEDLKKLAEEMIK